MRYLLSLMVVACCGGGVLAEEPATPGPDELQALVKQLGSQDFDEREDAQLRLTALGHAAREVLTHALKDADPEISASAAMLLDKINRAVVAVRVVDSTEKPLAKVPVVFNLYLRDGRRSVSVLRNETVNTDANGWASVGNIKPRDGYILNVSCRMPDYVPAAISQQRVELKVKRHEFKLVALRCATVTGTLLDKTQGPLTDRRLSLVPSNRLRLLENPKHARFAFRNASTATTDERGQFRFEGVNPGEYAVALMGSKGLLFKSDTIEVEAEETLSMGAVATTIHPAVLKRDDDVLKDDDEDPLPEM